MYVLKFLNAQLTSTGIVPLNRRNRQSPGRRIHHHIRSRCHSSNDQQVKLLLARTARPQHDKEASMEEEPVLVMGTFSDSLGSKVSADGDRRFSKAFLSM